MVGLAVDVGGHAYVLPEGFAGASYEDEDDIQKSVDLMCTSINFSGCVLKTA